MNVKIDSEKTMKPEIKKTAISTIMAITPIPFCMNSAGSPTKPMIKRIKNKLTIRTANQGVIVRTYCLTPAADTKIVATRKEINNKSQGFASPKSFVFAKIAYRIMNTIRKAKMGAKYVNPEISAGILSWGK